MTPSTPAVTPDLVQSWRPCREYPPERLRELMPQGRLTLPEVAELPTPDLDRVWILAQCMAAETRAGFAARVARDVLPVWEARFPGDARPRRAVEAAEACARDPTPANADAARAARDAATYAAADAARAAARADAWTTTAADAARVVLWFNAAWAAAHAAAHADTAWIAADLATTAWKFDGRAAEHRDQYVAWALEAATAHPNTDLPAVEAPE